MSKGNKINNIPISLQMLSERTLSIKTTSKVLALAAYILKLERYRED